jgi:hypothetical protein
MKTLIFFLLLVNNFLFSKDINILFVTQEFNSKEKKEMICQFSSELSNFKPLDVFSGNLFFFETSNAIFNDAVKFTYNAFIFDSKILIKSANFYKDATVFIFIKKSQESKGIGGNIGIQKIPVIGITSGANKGIILHEFAHSIFNLGDEYGGKIEFPPTDKEMEGIPNLTLKPFDPLWENIKVLTNDDKISYYEGGMGRNKGIFHSYPECLMLKTEKSLCPVCLYHSIIKLNNITGNNIDFIDYIHQDMNAKKSPVPIIKHLQ